MSNTDSSIDKVQYTSFLEKTSHLIFQTPNWLNSVAGNTNWSVVLAYKGDTVVGAMPYVTSTKFGIKQITLPVFTPYLGPVFCAPHDLAPKNIEAFKTKTTLQLIEQLPRVGRFITNTDFNFNNWLPFAWNGYKQTTRYSYLLDTTPSLDVLLNCCGPNIKKDLKKSADLVIESNSTINSIFEIVKTDYSRKNIPLYFKKETLEQLAKQFSSGGALQIYQATKNDCVVASICIVFDSHFAHYILGGVTFENRNSGAMSKLLWTAIEEAKRRKVTFNFEGSMHQGIGQYFKSFGGMLTPYHQLHKVSHPLLKPFSKFSF